MNENVSNSNLCSISCKTHNYYPASPDRYIYRYIRPGLSVLDDPTLNEIMVLEERRRKDAFARNIPKERLQSHCNQSASLADVSCLNSYPRVL
jgi:hypothetical protein